MGDVENEGGEKGIRGIASEIPGGYSERHYPKTSPCARHFLHTSVAANAARRMSGMRFTRSVLRAGRHCSPSTTLPPPGKSCPAMPFRDGKEPSGATGNSSL